MSARRPYEPPRITDVGLLGPNGRLLNELRLQVERESALRRAIAGACPLVPLGVVHGFAAELMGMQTELELAAAEKRP